MRHFLIPSSLFFQVFFSSCSLFSFSGPNLHPSSTGKTKNVSAKRSNVVKIFFFYNLLFIYIPWALRPSPPLTEFQVSEAMAEEASKLLRIHVNKLLQVSYDIAMGRDSELFIKVAVYLFLIAFIGSLMDFQTLCHTGQLISLVDLNWFNLEDSLNRGCWFWLFWQGFWW